MKILAVNAGSSSFRLAAYDTSNGNIECLWRRHGEVSTSGPQQLLEQILATQHVAKFDVAAHRLVHGGNDIVRPRLVDEKSKERIRALVPLAPLRNSVSLAWLEAAEAIFGPEVPEVVVPDTGFYEGLPERARRYPLSSRLCEELGIRRFGFHGLAHESMLRSWPKVAAPVRPQSIRLISLQLGSGCSITASFGGAPIDTSMGYTPLEGLVMATRAGDLDPGIVLRLMQEGLDADRINEILNQESGLLGLSGFSEHMQDLLPSSSSEAQSAIEIYCYRARKYLGAYLVALGGADAILFGGGVGENSPKIRATILNEMAWLGVELDKDKNECASNGTRKISKALSRVAVWVVQVDEEWLMAEAAYNLRQDYHSGQI